MLPPFLLHIILFSVKLGYKPAWDSCKAHKARNKRHGQTASTYPYFGLGGGGGYSTTPSGICQFLQIPLNN